jgi:hypothetical protein
MGMSLILFRIFGKYGRVAESCGQPAAKLEHFQREWNSVFRDRNATLPDCYSRPGPTGILALSHFRTENRSPLFLKML